MLHLVDTHNHIISYCHKTSYQLIDCEIIFGFIFAVNLLFYSTENYYETNFVFKSMNPIKPTLQVTTFSSLKLSPLPIK